LTLDTIATNSTKTNITTIERIPTMAADFQAPKVLVTRSTTLDGLAFTEIAYPSLSPVSTSRTHNGKPPINVTGIHPGNLQVGFVDETCMDRSWIVPSTC